MLQKRIMPFILLLFLLSSCESGVNETPPIPPAANSDSSVLQQCLDLLGQADTDIKDNFSGSEANYDMNNTDLLGRTYQISLFGENVTMETIYGPSDHVISLNIYCNETDFESIKTKMKEIYGAPLDPNSSSASTNLSNPMWLVVKGEIYLKQTGNTVCIQMMLPARG